MAVYEVVQERLLLPYKYEADTGVPARHDTPKADLAVDERGHAEQAIGRLDRGALIYQTKGDFGKLSEAQKATARYCDNKTAINSLLNREETLKELNPAFVAPIKEVEFDQQQGQGA